jgi:hypothetical protein
MGNRFILHALSSIISEGGIAWHIPGVKPRSRADFFGLSLSKNRSTNEELRSLKAFLEVNSFFRQENSLILQAHDSHFLKMYLASVGHLCKNLRLG